LQLTRNELAANVLAHYLPLVRAKRQMPSGVQLMRNAGIEPDAWQVEVLTSPSTRLLLNCCRQSGKSTTLAALGLHTALAHPGALVLCLSPSQRQAGELYRKMVELYDATPGLPPIAKLSELRLEFSTRSRILIIPADERRGVRGYSRPDLVIFDEASGIPDDVFSAARPLFATHQRGKFVLSSTPRGQRGTFYEEWEHGEGWQRWTVAADQCPRISPEFLARERATLGSNWYLQEYFCKFLQPLLAVFDYQMIDDAADDSIPSLFDSPMFAGS
jgi:hypothetical protein